MPLLPGVRDLFAKPMVRKTFFNNSPMYKLVEEYNILVYPPDFPACLRTEDFAHQYYWPIMVHADYNWHSSCCQPFKKKFGGSTSLNSSTVVTHHRKDWMGDKMAGRVEQLRSKPRWNSNRAIENYFSKMRDREEDDFQTKIFYKSKKTKITSKASRKKEKRKQEKYGLALIIIVRLSMNY